MTAAIIVSSFVAVIVFLSWLGCAIERANDELDRVSEEMYYEQAERDGCEYPPQWKG